MPPVQEWYYNNQPSYRQYLNQDPATGRKERLDDLMPRLLFSEGGRLLLVPGEVFCRWRNDDDTLCKRKHAFNSHSNLREHYMRVHGSRVKPRPVGSCITREYHLKIRIWYNALVHGNKPFWIPSEEEKEDITGGALAFDFDFVEEKENDYEWTAEEGGNG
ncbi:hypothetical protein HDV63DRAFT_401017 [Trichoderma sp. SZMC 28014]